MLRIILKVLATAAFLYVAPLFLHIRISPKYIDNQVLENPEVFKAFENPGVVITAQQRMQLKGIILAQSAEKFDSRLLYRNYQEQALIELNPDSSRAFYKYQKIFGGCGNTGSVWSQLPRKRVLRNEKRDLGLYLVEHFHAFPEPDAVDAEDQYSQELIRAFLKSAQFRKARYDGLNRQQAEVFIDRLLPTLEGRDYYNALWFFGSLHPEKLKFLAINEIEIDLNRPGRGEAYHYLKYLEFHSPESYLDYIHKVQVSLGHGYASDQEYYAKILLKAGDWRGIDTIMAHMRSNRDRYFANGFRMTGDLCWPIARAALDEHPDEFEDHNAINPYIGRWYLENRSRIGFTGQRIQVEGSKLTQQIEGNSG